MGVIYILWLRQLKRYWRSKARIIGSLGQPIFFLLALGFGFGSVYQKAGAGNYFEFLAPGIIAMSILFNAMFNGIEVIWDRQFGFLKETLVAPVSRIRIMIGKTLGGATVAFIQGLIVFVIASIFGFRITSSSIPLAIIFMALIAIIFTAVGIAIASKMEDMHAFPLIMNLLIMPLFFLSGALFPIENLPSVMEIIVKANPLSYGVDGIRGALTGVAQMGMFIDFIVLFLLAVVALLAGAYLFSKVEA